MDQEDRERVLRHYEAVFDDAGPEGEDALIRSMGSPVRQVLAIERELREAQSQGRVLYGDEDVPAPGEEPAEEPYYEETYEPAYEAPADGETPDNWETEELSESWETRETPDDWGTGESPEGWETVGTAYAYEGTPAAEELPMEEELPGEEETPAEEPYDLEPLEEQDAPTRAADVSGEDMVFGDYLATEEDADGWEALPMYGQDIPAADREDIPPAAENAAEPDWTDEIPELKDDYPEPEDQDLLSGGDGELEEESDGDDYLSEDLEDADADEDSDFERDPEDGYDPEEDVEADEDAEEDGQEPEEERSAPGAGRVAAASAATIPMLAVWVLSFAAIIVLGIVLLAAGFAACVAGIYLGGYVFSGAIAYMPDLLLTCGLALLGLAVALLLIWTGIWIIVAGCGAVVRLSRRMYQKILYGSAAAGEEDEADD